MKGIVLSAVFSVIFSVTCKGQLAYTLSGYVVDSNGRPVEGALITVDRIPLICKGCLDIVSEAVRSDECGFFWLQTVAKPGQRMGFYIRAPVSSDYYPLGHFFEGNSLVPRELRMSEFTVGKSARVELGRLTPILNFRNAEFPLSQLIGASGKELTSVKFGVATHAGVEIAAPISVPSE